MQPREVTKMRVKLVFIWLICLTATLCAETEEKTFSATVELDGVKVPYKCTAGFLPIHGEEGKLEASLFYFAYHKENPGSQAARPVTFCFNGGPGASAVWLHLGGFGPKRVDIPDVSFPEPPFHYSDNPYSLLDVTDLVFVDPVSTGFSRSAAGVDPKKFYNVKEDTRVLADFVRLYVTKNKLWNAPKYLMGESYGGYRIAMLATYLHDVSYLYLNGLIFISPAINLQTIMDPNDGNDLPYPLAIPSYTAAWWYHKKLPNVEEALSKAEAFALGPYATALLKGDTLTGQEKDKLVEELTHWSGLSKDYLLRAQFRVLPGAYAHEVFKSSDQTIGRFDSRYFIPSIYDRKPILGSLDPSAEAYLGAFTSAIWMYLEQIGWQTTESYDILSDASPWDFNQNNQYPTAGDKLRNLMTKNPHLRVFVGAGYYDLATTYESISYSFNHLGLDPSLLSHLRERHYFAGHMIYLDNKALPKLKNDLKQFYSE